MQAPPTATAATAATATAPIPSDAPVAGNVPDAPPVVVVAAPKVAFGRVAGAIRTIGAVTRGVPGRADFDVVDNR